MGAGHWEGSESHFGGFLERDPGSEGEGLLLVAAIQTGAAGRVGIASAMHPQVASWFRDSFGFRTPKSPEKALRSFLVGV